MSLGRLLAMMTMSAFALAVALASSVAGADSTALRQGPARGIDVGPIRSYAVVARKMATTRLEERLLRDIQDGTLDGHDLPEAALIAGGINHPEPLARYREKFRVHIRAVRRMASQSENQRQLAEQIFGYLHQQVFTGKYRADCTDIAETLDRGNYNCVSGTILFVSLAKSCGLSCQALETPAHVLARVAADGQWIDVELTDPHWFKRSRPHRHLASGRLLDTRQLVALVYYNRGVDQLTGGHHAAAVAANLVTLQFDPLNKTAQANLLAAWNNWALSQAQQGHFEQAVDLLSRGVRASPDYDNFVENDVYVHKCWYEALLDSGHRPAALKVLSQARRRHPADRRIDFWQQAVGGRVSAGR